MEDNKEKVSVENNYEAISKDIQELVATVSNAIQDHDNLKTKNFGLFYQHGRLGYVDLDVFAEKINAEQLLKSKKGKKIKKSIDKINKK